MKVKTIKNEKWDAIKRIAYESEKLVNGSRNKTKENSRIKEKLLKENLSKKEIELKIGKRYMLVIKEVENLGTRKWLDTYTSIRSRFFEITKETDCYIMGVWKSDRIKKENILAVVEE